MNEYLQEQVKIKASAEIRLIAKKELQNNKETCLYKVFETFKVFEFITYWASDRIKNAYLQNAFTLEDVAFNTDFDEVLSDFDKESIGDEIISMLEMIEIIK